MSILTDKLPDGVFIDGVKYRVHTNFRNWLKLEEIVGEDLEIHKKISKMLKMCYIDLPPKLDGAIESLFKFYCLNKPPDEKKKSSGSPKKILSFSHDADYIYCAFLTQYNINLQKEDLHWWQFMALLKGLDSSNKICKIMEIRAADISKIKDGEIRSAYRKMKKLYALPDNRDAREIDMDIIRGLEELF